MISEPFELLRLPKTSARTKATDTIIVGDKLLFVGVSNSFISTLSLRPPQVLSAHSVPPGTIITAILSSDTELLGYATKERNKYYIKLLQQGSSADTKGVISKEVKEEVGALFLCTGGHTVAAVSKSSSQLRGFSKTDLSEAWCDRDEPKEKLVYSAISDSAQAEAVCVLVQSSSNCMSVRTVELGHDGAHTLLTAKIEGPHTTPAALAASYFSVNPSTHLLYQLFDRSLSAYALPAATLHSHLELVDGPAVSGMLSLPNNNVVIARSNTIELIDCTFDTNISTLQLSGSSPAKLLAFSPSASAIAVSQGDEVLLGLTVTPTKGTLFESIGMRSMSKLESFAFADIFNGFTEAPQNFKATAASQINNADRELTAVVQSLRHALDVRDGSAFAEVVTYLKDPSLSWTEWHESGQATAPSTQDVVYVDTDRNSGSELIRTVAELAFLPTYHSFLPQGVAVYLLTHPLFPYGEPKFSSFLRTLERSHPLLYRQAIVSLPGVTVTDLVLALMNRDEHTFLEAVARLQEEFGPQQILGAIRKAFAGVRSLSSLTVIVDRLSRYPEAVALVAPFIDAMGLLAWKPEHISQLRERLTSQVTAVQDAAKADTAIIDLCQSVGIDLSAGNAIPTEAELQKRQQRNKAAEQAPRRKRAIPRYSIETLVL